MSKSFTGYKLRLEKKNGNQFSNYVSLIPKPLAGLPIQYWLKQSKISHFLYSVYYYFLLINLFCHLLLSTLPISESDCSLAQHPLELHANTQECRLQYIRRCSPGVEGCINCQCQYQLSIFPI